MDFCCNVPDEICRSQVALDKRLDAEHARASRTKRKVVSKAVRRQVSSRKHGESGGLFEDEGADVAASSTHLGALEDLEKWDNKTRNEALRSMPSFRPCPHCGGRNRAGSGSSPDSGGGAGSALCGGVSGSSN